MNQGQPTKPCIELLEGEELKYYNIVEHEIDKLFRMIMSFVKVHQDAEDVIQDLYIDLWRKKKDIKSEDEVRYFLYSRARYLSLKFLSRSKQNDERMSDFIKGLDTYSNTSPMVESEYEEQVLKLNKAIMQLPEYQRRVLLMNVYDGLKRREISEKLNISPQTVSNHLHEAIKKLKEILAILIISILGINKF